jgi:hypothetical protein
MEGIAGHFEYSVQILNHLAKRSLAIYLAEKRGRRIVAGIELARANRQHNRSFASAQRLIGNTVGKRKHRRIIDHVKLPSRIRQCTMWWRFRVIQGMLRDICG